MALAHCGMTLPVALADRVPPLPNTLSLTLRSVHDW